jgi:cytoskeletal protein RodZ
VPEGSYALAFILRDHGSTIARERMYTLAFRLARRLLNNEDNELTTPLSSLLPLLKSKQLLTRLFPVRVQWRVLLILLISWIILVVFSVWTCYRYDHTSRNQQKLREQQQQRFEVQVRQHEIVGQAFQTLPESSSFPVTSLQPPEKETLTQEDDEIEDTSYDADHIMTDANFVLTSGCAVNESAMRYVSSFFER